MSLPRRSIPSISGLIAFEATARNLSFSRAAKDLALSQGAISKRVRQLEEQLGVLLIARGAQQIQLTQIGERYLPKVRDLLGQVERATLDLQSEAGRPRKLTIRCDFAFAEGWLIPRLGEFARLHPEIRIDLCCRNDDAETDHREDLSIQLREADDNAGVSLFADERLVVAGGQLAAGRTDRELLRSQPLLSARGEEETWALWLRRNGAEERVDEIPEATSFDHPALLIAAAVHGCGIALVPRLLVRNELAEGRLLQLGTSIETDARYVLSVPAHCEERPDVAKFRKWLVRSLSRHPHLRSLPGGMTDPAEESRLLQRRSV